MNSPAESSEELSGSTRWITRRHPLWVEMLLLVGTYAAYDASRGLADGSRAAAVRNGLSVALLERHLGLLVEHPVQRLAEGVPGLMGVLGFDYAMLHIGVTVVVLFWLYRSHPGVYPRMRTAVIIATGLALIGFIFFPVAPPRLDGIGVVDTLSLGRATSESGLLKFLYNPYAAMPSVHIAFATLVALCVVCYGRSYWRLAGLLYPVYVAFEVLATGNHFLLDVAAGAVTAVAASVISSLWLHQPRLAVHRSGVLGGATVTPIRSAAMPTVEQAGADSGGAMDTTVRAS